MSNLQRLEHTLGPKLDRTLDEGSQSLDEIAIDLRAATAPENRTMGVHTTLAFLALALSRLGRTAEAEAELYKMVDAKFSISASGAWVGAAAAGSHMHDRSLSATLGAFFLDRGARSVADFGCGLGLYVRDFREVGLRAGGVDGNPSTSEISEGRCLQADLSRDFDFGTGWDWLLSLEVAEHIPREFEATFLGNIERHACRGIVLSWGNQDGEGHVNLRSQEEVEELFLARGFRSLRAEAAELRASAVLPWLQNTVLAFERDSSRLPPGGC